MLLIDCWNSSISIEGRREWVGEDEIGFTRREKRKVGGGGVYRRGGGRDISWVLNVYM